MSEEAVLIKNTENDFKQGRARKVNADNFYMICEYLTTKKEKLTDLFYSDDYKKNKANEEHVALFIEKAPSEFTSRASIEKSVKFNTHKISKLNKLIRNEEYLGFYNSKERCETEINKVQKTVENRKANYVELTNEMMHELHLILMEIQDDPYASLQSWMKQKRYREKTKTQQVTLSPSGKYALDALKAKLNADNFNDLLIELNKLH